MNSVLASPCPIGIVMNAVVVGRIRALVDDYGAVCVQGGLVGGRSQGLAKLLRAMMRNLRLEAVEGERYCLIRRRDLLIVLQKGAQGVRPRVVNVGRMEG